MSGTERTDSPRWVIAEHGIAWTVRPGEVHRDHVEMSGSRVAVIVTYGVDQLGRLLVSREVIWPLLRFGPNRTRDHFALNFGGDALPRIFIDDLPRRHFVATHFKFDGLLVIEGTLEESPTIAFCRTIFPALDAPVVFETVELRNRSGQTVAIEIEANERRVATNPNHGIDGGYLATASIQGVGRYLIAPGDALTFVLEVAARHAEQAQMPSDPVIEERARRGRLRRLQSTLRLETPDPTINTLFALTKIRTGESVYATRHGPMHSPGGGVFYAAMWANDQAEYANPYFGYLGDERTSSAAINCFRLFARYMNPAYRPIPSAITAEGLNTWHGAGDRGDMAMLAYGIGRFALPLADAATAHDLWPLLEWCLEYCQRKLTPDGVVASDSDELENRYPAGTANLCTSSLYYDALQSAAMLGRELGKSSDQCRGYVEQARRLAGAIDDYFAAQVAGFDTYRYYDGNTVLRAWICIPLTVGLMNHAAGTLAALFSPQLWTADGVLTAAGDTTFWDRTTLYALRAALAAGDVERGVTRLVQYSARRLLGEHVPYPVEAYPEGNQRQLAAESALYGRIFTEGLFGIRPTGFRTFELRPRLPESWPRMALRQIRAHGTTFDVGVTRQDESLEVRIHIADRSPLVTTVTPGGGLAVDLAIPSIAITP